jgi:hypothetical protein
VDRRLDSRTRLPVIIPTGRFVAQTGEGMTTQQRGEEKRARILEAAAAGFAEQGYDGTSAAEICHRAEVSKGAFYHHFSSRICSWNCWSGGSTC